MFLPDNSYFCRNFRIIKIKNMALQEEFEKQGIFLFKYRGILPLIILAAALWVYILKEIDSNGYFENTYEKFYEYFCLMVTIIGLFIRAYTVGFTPKNTSGRNTEEQVADELNSTGIYSIVRHPLYVGNFLMWLGIGMFTQNLWFLTAFIFLYWVYYERIMYAEEQFLRRKFEKKYTDWAEKTPAFVPNIKLFKKPSLKFSFKKVLKKEKNGFFAVFLVIFIFKAAGNFFSNKNFDVEAFIKQEIFWTIAMASSMLIYFILKILKSKTTVLNEEGR